VGLESRVVNRCAALHAKAKVARVHPLYGRRDFRHLVSSLISQGINDLAILKFFSTFLGVGVITTPHIRRDSIQSCGQITFLLLKLPA
jgi:hypothetical protein